MTTGTKIEIDGEGARIYKDGKLTKSGPLHVIRDHLDHEENMERLKRKRKRKSFFRFLLCK